MRARSCQMHFGTTRGFNPLPRMVGYVQWVCDMTLPSTFVAQAELLAMPEQQSCHPRTPRHQPVPETMSANPHAGGFGAPAGFPTRFQTGARIDHRHRSGVDHPWTIFPVVLQRMSKAHVGPKMSGNVSWKTTYCINSGPRRSTAPRPKHYPLRALESKNPWAPLPQV